MQYSFSEEIKKFIEHINSLESNFEIIYPINQIAKSQAGREFNQYLDKFGEKQGEGRVKVPAELTSQASKLQKAYERSIKAEKLVSRGYIVSLVSLYDAYLGRLIRVMFYNKPEVLNKLKKEMTFSEITNYQSIDEIKEYVIEKETETVLRKSHTEHFDWLESKLDMTLRKNLDVWTQFIEITERRNLFVHTDGVVSSQYINVCKQQGVKFKDKVSVGNVLEADLKYFNNTYESLYELGVKLGQVMWRKLQPIDIEKAEVDLNNICFELISNGKYNLAIKLLKFALSFPKAHSAEGGIKYFQKINLALAYKLSKQEEDCLKVLGEIQFRDLSYQLRLANAVLTKDYQNAKELMLLVTEEEVGKGTWNEWPLFKEFKETDEFKEGYLQKYGEEFKGKETQSTWKSFFNKSSKVEEEA